MRTYGTSFTLHRPSRWRYVRWGLLVLLAIAAALGGFGWYYIQGSLPASSGTAVVPGLDQPVTVERDLDGIPLIRAQTDRDGYFTLGYVHAQDRFFQMEMQRRVGAGRLSEVAGDRALRFDKLMRTLGLYRRAEAVFSDLSPTLRDALAAYADGVNAWLATRDGPLPPEFLVAGGEPEPWKPADSLVWGEVMALNLGANWNKELLRARLATRLTDTQIDEMFPAVPAAAPITLGASRPGPDDAAAPVQLARDGLDRQAVARLLDRTLLDALPPALQPTTASNAWVLSGDLTATGKPILANDPHLGFRAPILWYLARLEIGPQGGGGSRILAGATVPGVPIFVVGHNGRIAWGLTTTAADVQDLFIEKIDPQNPSQYMTPDGPELFERRDEVIQVGEEVVTHTVRSTRHGPVISDVDPSEADFVEDGHVVALAWTALQEPNMTAQAMFDINRAATWDEFREAIRNFHAPMQNIAYADIDGNIGIASPARVPIRRNGDGRTPVPGWTGAYDWIGTIPFERLPLAVNPPAGRLINANNQLVPPTYPYLITGDWPYAAYRAQRITEMLDPGTAGGAQGESRPAPHTVDASADLQLDVQSLFAEDMLPVLTEITVSDPALNQALGMLRSWDGSMRRNRPEPLIFSMWWRELARHLYSDELGAELFDEFADWNTIFVRTILTDRQHWCDNVETADRTESCAVQIAAALGDAIARLQDAHGEDMAAWRWGEAHAAEFKHPLFGYVPFLRDFTDLTIPTDGGTFTVSRGASRLDRDDARFPHGFGSGLRALFDLSDLDRSRFMIATGQSGNPLSPLYGNLLQRWRDGLYVTLQPRRGPTADGATLPVLTLVPGASGG